MLIFTIAFLLGDLYLQTFAELPTKASLIYLITLVSFLFGVFHKRLRFAYFFLALALGFIYSAWYAEHLLSWSLPDKWEGKPVMVTGIIASLPVNHDWKTSFLFSVQRIQYDNEILKHPTNIKLVWHDAGQELKVGDKWQLLVRLKKIHGVQNPGGFDYEAWALQKGLRAAGYVIANNKENIRLHSSRFKYPIDQIRQSISESIKILSPQSETAPWLIALTIGERQGIDPAHWQILRNTGTNHLMAIAGLHIGLAASFIYFLIVRVYKYFPRLMLRMPAQHAGAYAALLTALLYSALAGFSIPTQRACIMLSVFMFMLLSKRKINAWYAWAAAMLIVLLLNPLSVLTESFWLSFGTIALIIYCMQGRLAPTGVWWHWGRVQWVIGVGLVPFTLFMFHESSLISFFANSIAVPWLGLFILPFCLLSIIFIFPAPKLAALCLYIADKSLSYLWAFLTWFSHLSFATWQHYIPNNFLLILTLAAFMILLLPAGFPGRWIGLCWLLPVLCYQPTKPEFGDFWLNLLDVGQGLAAVVQTKTHTLIYDTGPKYITGFDSGEHILLPYLQTINTKKIDMLVISHGDNDHSGGAESLLKALPVMEIKTSTPEKFLSFNTHYCLSGTTWTWDGVSFSFLYPATDNLNLGNNSSCVLRIDNGNQSLLLTGDIEKFAEKELLKSPLTLKSNVLIAPHHGSKTSGLPSFIKAVSPEIVLYPIGYRNRYHFPHQSVVSTYQKISAKQLNTADAGMIFMEFSHGNMPYPKSYRSLNKKYWFAS